MDRFNWLYRMLRMFAVCIFGVAVAKLFRASQEGVVILGILGFIVGAFMWVADSASD